MISTDYKTICVRSTPHANSPSPELALEIAPLIHPAIFAITGSYQIGLKNKDVSGGSSSGVDGAQSSEDTPRVKEITDKSRLATIPLEILWKVAGTNSNDPKEWVAFQKLMERPWWRRIWVIQEIAATKNPILVGCGTYWQDWEKFEWAGWRVANYENSQGLDRMTRLGSGTTRIHDKVLLRARADEQMDNWSGLLELLYRSQSYLATDPRDRLFALFGFLPSTGLVADYTIGAEEVFEMLVRHSIYHSKDLAMLTLNRSPKELRLPSWVPDFSSTLFEDEYNNRCPLGFFGADGNNRINFGTPSTGCKLVKDEPGQLTVFGFMYDMPQFLGSTWDSVQEERQAKVFGVIDDYESMMHTVDAEHFPEMPGKPREESFWRALIWNATGGDRYPAPPEYSTAFIHLRTKTAYIASADVRPRKGEKTEDRPDLRVVPNGDASRYYEAFLRNGFRRRFFITAKGHLGSGPAEMEKDDEICILFGAKAPTILRASGQGYQLIGHAYVHGIMHGEALSAMDFGIDRGGRQTLRIQNFVLV